MTDLPSARRCPACGAANHPDRELCGTCAADLDDGSTLPKAVDPRLERSPGATWTGRDRAAPGRPDPRHRGVGRSWTVALAVVLGVALVVVGLTLVGVGPFATGPDVPAASFDAGRYGSDTSPLALRDIATRSTREEVDGRSVDPSMMVDDDPATAWRSEGSPLGASDGPNETIDLQLTEPGWVSRIVVRNGDHHDADAYADTARIQEARVVLDGGVAVPVFLQDLGLQEQAIEFPEPLLTTAVRIEVRRVFTGGEFDDLAVSDLRLEGWAATPEDAELAQRRARARPATGPPNAVGRLPLAATGPRGQLSYA